jgi:hypothetical protein
MHTRFRTATLVLVLTASTAWAGERPAAKGMSPLSSPVTTTRKDEGRFAGLAYFKSLPEDQRKELSAKGHILLSEDKSGAGTFSGYIRAVAIFKQPKKRVFELMHEPTKQALYLPHLVSATTQTLAPNGELVEFAIKVMMSTYHYHTQHWFYPEQSRVEWTLDSASKNDIKVQDGYWQLFELSDGATIGEYGTRIETGLAVPKFVQDIFARDDIPKAMLAMRKYIDSNGTFRREE